MNAPVTIKGWCPSALHPMPSGDGLLVRVRTPFDGLSAAQVRALARAATRFGNGLMDLTARANLQIRGVREALWPDLLDALSDAHLLDPGDANAAPINILLPPLTGLDQSALLDASVVAGAIESGLRADPTFSALPSKFGFAIDDGGALVPGDIDADISLAARSLPDGDVVVQIAVHEASACVPAADAAAAALRLAWVFLKLRRDERRMRTLVDRVGAAQIFAQAGLVSEHLPLREPNTFANRSLLGATDVGGRPILGVAAPFGAWTAEGFASLADVMCQDAGTSLRLTPWRIMLLTGLAADVAQPALASFAARNLIVTTHDARLSIAACTGAPGCASASVATRPLAQELSMLVPDVRDGIVLHVSGCAKGCAHPHAAPITLVGRAGLFDLVAGGQPGDVPETCGIAASSTFAAVQGRFVS